MTVIEKTLRHVPSHLSILLLHHELLSHQRHSNNLLHLNLRLSHFRHPDKPQDCHPLVSHLLYNSIAKDYRVNRESLSKIRNPTTPTAINTIIDTDPSLVSMRYQRQRKKHMSHSDSRCSSLNSMRGMPLLLRPSHSPSTRHQAPKLASPPLQTTLPRTIRLIASGMRIKLIMEITASNSSLIRKTRVHLSSEAARSERLLQSRAPNFLQAKANHRVQAASVKQQKLRTAVTPLQIHPYLVSNSRTSHIK